MDVSVIIPALNAASTIEEQLRALSAQHFDGSFEVLVVDNGSTDDTAGIVNSYSAIDDRVRLLDGSSVPFSGGAARNIGVEQSLADLLVFCDADDVVDVHWMTALVDGLGSSAVVTSSLEFWRLNPHTLHRTTQQFLGPYRVLGFPGIPGGAFGMWRSAYLEVGGFDPTFASANDSEFAVRVGLAGHEVKHRDDAIVHVRLRSTALKQFVRARALRSSIEKIRELNRFAPRPRRTVAIRVLVYGRDLAAGAIFALHPHGTGAWMRLAGEACADLELLLRSLWRRSTTG